MNVIHMWNKFEVGQGYCCVQKWFAFLKQPTNYIFDKMNTQSTQHAEISFFFINEHWTLNTEYRILNSCAYMQIMLIAQHFNICARLNELRDG